MSALTVLVQLGCALTLLGALGFAVREARDVHQRGMSRVHAGTSWTPRAERGGRP